MKWPRWGFIRDFEGEMLAREGWCVHYVAGGRGGGDPAIGYEAHTHGLAENYGHPDLQMVAPLGAERTHDIFAELVDRVKAGEVLEAGGRYPGIILRYDVLLAEAWESGRTVLRVILPDADGEFRPDPMGPWMAQQWEGVEGATGAGGR